MRKSLLVLVALIAIDGCATGFKPNRIQRMRFEPARQAEQRGDYATALAVYESAAEDGIAYAQYRVARMYESGLGTEPEITFSACFGGPFMVHHPYVYADLLKKKMLQHGARCWLVNTGWTGGPFGIGKRISIGHTRRLLDAALSGALDAVPYRKDPIFGFEVPESCDGVPSEILDPANTWGSREEYFRKYDALAARFIENFKTLAAGCPPEVAEGGPKRRRVVAAKTRA